MSFRRFQSNHLYSLTAAIECCRIMMSWFSFWKFFWRYLTGASTVFTTLIFIMTISQCWQNECMRSNTCWRPIFWGRRRRYRGTANLLFNRDRRIQQSSSPGHRFSVPERRKFLAQARGPAGLTARLTRLCRCAKRAAKVANLTPDAKDAARIQISIVVLWARPSLSYEALELVI